MSLAIITMFTELTSNCQLANTTKIIKKVGDKKYQKLFGVGNGNLFNKVMFPVLFYTEAHSKDHDQKKYIIIKQHDRLYKKRQTDTR